MSNNANNFFNYGFEVTTDSPVAIILRRDDVEIIDSAEDASDKFISAWTPILEKGLDILHISVSSAVSPAYETACAISKKLKASYPERKIVIFDTLSVSLGEGFQVLNACKLRESGLSLSDTVKALLEKREKQVELFSANSHRIRKPILKGNYCGEIVLCSHAGGRLGAIKKLVADFMKNHDKSSSDPVGIAYDGSKRAAERLLKLLRKAAPEAEFFTIFESTSFRFGKNTVALFYTCT